jgi:hypothetical protein
MPMVKSTNAIGIAVLLHAVEQSPTALMKITYTQIKMAQVIVFLTGTHTVVIQIKNKYSLFIHFFHVSLEVNSIVR